MSNKTLPDLVIGSDPDTYETRYILSRRRFRHCYILGKTGKGKSTLYHRCILKDIIKNKATFFFDPGNTAKRILETIPERRVKDTKYFDLQYPIPYNPLEASKDKDGRVDVDEVCDLIDRVIELRSSAIPLTERMRRILAEALPEICKQPNPSFADIKPYLVKNKPLLMDKLNLAPTRRGEDPYQTSIDGIIDRLNPFLHDPPLRRITCSPHQLDFSDIIDSQQIFIASFAGLDEGRKRFLGTLLFHGLQKAIMERPEPDRLPLAVYVDEFHNFIASKRAVNTFQTLFKEGRQYLLSLFVAHQDFGGIDRDLLNSVLGNVASYICFTCGDDEAQRMSREFIRHFPPEDFQSLPDYHALCRTEDYEGNVEMYRIQTDPPPKPIRQDITPFFYQATFEKLKERPLEERPLEKPEKELQEAGATIQSETEDDFDLDHFLRTRWQN